MSKKNQKKDYAIRVKNISKSFKLPTEQSHSIKQAFINWTRGVKGYKEQKVLHGISFDVEKGDFFGIVGRNGSGKSTLLKLISDIYQPDSGSNKVNGSLVSFIELGVGFNPELTGRENIYLNGALMGFTSKEVDAMYDEIVEFAELDEFMDQKLKNYSSGMKVRLAFSCAIQAKSDILVLDEILAVGDESFQRKCNDFFENIKEDPNKTVVLVTHSMRAVQEYCNRAIMIDEGKIVAKGSPYEVASEYSLRNFDESKQVEKTESDGFAHGRNELIPKLDVVLHSKPVLTNDNTLKFSMDFELTEEKDVYVGFSLIYGGRSLFERNSSLTIDTNKKGKHSLKYTMPLNVFSDGNLKISCAVFDKKTKKLLAYTTDDAGTKRIKIISKDHSKDKGGIIDGNLGEWSKTSK